MIRGEQAAVQAFSMMNNQGAKTRRKDDETPRAEGGLERAESPANLQTQHETVDPILPRCLAGAGGRLSDWKRGLQSFKG